MWRRVALLVMCACRHGFEPLADGTIVDTPETPDAMAPDFCARVPALAAAPVLDGVPDVVPLQRLVPVAWMSPLDPLPPLPAVPVDFAVAWRPDGIYFVVDVHDPDRHPSTQLSYCGDSVELYIDSDGAYPGAPLYDQPGALQLIAVAPADDVTPRVDGALYADAALVGAWSSGFRTFPRAGGYVLEAFVDAGTLGLAQWSLAAGGAIGLDLGINVSAPDGAFIVQTDCSQNRRLGQFFLRIDETYADPYDGAPFKTTTAFCTATLE